MSDTPLSESADEPAPELNPLLERAQLAEKFNRTGRVQISNVLTDASARRLFSALERETPWGLYFQRGREPTGVRNGFRGGSSGDGHRGVGSRAFGLRILLSLLPPVV